MKTPLQFPTAPAAGAPLLVSYLEAAGILGGVSTRHIARLVAARKLRSVGSGRARRIVYSSILSYVEKEAA